MEATVSQADYDTLQAKYNALEHRFAQLVKLVNGAKSERFVPTTPAEQMSLWEEQQKVGADAGTGGAAKQKITYERNPPKPHPGRTALPEHLPTRQVIVEPAEDTTGMTRVGQDITRKVDYTPATLEIVEYVRPRYARPKAEQTEDAAAIIVAEVPDQVIPKGIPAAGLLAHLVISKYIDHLPFYRQIRMIQRDYDWTIHKSTINGWFAAVCTLLKPLYDRLTENVLNTDYLQGDESRILVLEKSKDPPKKKMSEKLKPGAKRHLGYMWVFRNPGTGNVLFVYRKGRGANVLHDHGVAA